MSNFNVFNNIKITLYYSVCMCTSGQGCHMKISIKSQTVLKKGQKKAKPIV